MWLLHFSLSLPPAFHHLSGLSAITIAAGQQHTCASVSGGGRGVKCWGDNLYGQLGIGSTTDQNSPADVAGAARHMGGREEQ